jgi:hypothetical protein
MDVYNHLELLPSTTDSRFPLPKAYRPLSDGAFWCLLVWLLPYSLGGWSLIQALKPSASSDSWILVLVVLLLASYPIFLFWMARETYRWQFPNRGWLIALCVLLGWVGAASFMGYVRPERMMQVERERAEAERRSG